MKPNRKIRRYTIRVATVLLLGGFVFFIIQFAWRNSTAEEHEYWKKIVELPPPTPMNPSDMLQLKLGCEQWYTNFLANSPFNGGVIVSKGGNIIFERYKGVSRMGTQNAVTDTTPLHIASVSKTFTAMAILKLWEDGLINLDDPFSKYVPTFSFPDITIKNLLSHRSGLPNYTGFMEKSDYNKSGALSNRELLEYLISNKENLPPTGKANVGFSYCNTNYALLAILVEQISGTTFPDFLYTRFFRPLQMNHSFVRTDSDSLRINPSYDANGNSYPDNCLDRIYGDKNIYSTVRDLLTWDRALRSGLLFKPETLEAAYLGYSNEKPGNRNYGLGWRLLSFPKGDKMIYHNGWWHGNNASFLRLPKEDVCIIAIGSHYTKSVYKTRELLALFNPNAIVDTEE